MLACLLQETPELYRNACEHNRTDRPNDKPVDSRGACGVFFRAHGCLLSRRGTAGQRRLDARHPACLGRFRHHCAKPETRLRCHTVGRLIRCVEEARAAFARGVSDVRRRLCEYAVVGRRRSWRSQPALDALRQHPPHRYRRSRAASDSAHVLSGGAGGPI